MNSKIGESYIHKMYKRVNASSYRDKSQIKKSTTHPTLSFCVVPTSVRSIFVFGSNTKGEHGAGAAFDAVYKHGAIYGQAEGLQGDSYAIVTKDLSLGRRSIPLIKIEIQIKKLIDFAKDHPDWDFNVTPIGCGLAGYTYEEIAPMFGKVPKNMTMPKEFYPYLIH